ncbi:hypothetical protein AAU57_08805 [Nonlabens sp. YIK11]|uniref:lysozyme n=1 Tax=Nonlabens sp. YIK11 TaxID=1453349 RepID=UPI0006DCF708|nr:lysozyme [Nonlabens sp. YIK11]KQC33402.1 hypothetical protein AAU57_08805 [Nonlabens sp. YIK11]
MRLNNEGLEHIKKWESFRNHPYIPVKGDRPTIGYGNTFYADGTPVKMTDNPITLEQGETLLKLIVKQFEGVVNRYVTSDINQNQFNALVSFTYNVGSANFRRSTLLKKINNNPNDPSIEYQFKRWNKASGRVLKGLTRRRNSEAYYYFTPITDCPNILS